MHTNRKRRTARDSAAEPDSERIPERKRAFFRGSGPLILGATLLVVAHGCGVSGSGGQGSVSGTGSSQSSVLLDAAVVFLLILISSLFVMVEAAFLRVRRTRIEQLEEEGNRRAKLVAQMSAEPTRLLATLQVGLTLVQLFSAGEATTRFEGPLTNTLRAHFPNTWIDKGAHAISFVTIIASVSLLTLVIGEVTPKSIAVLHAEPIALWSAYPIRWIETLTKPLVSLVTWLSTLFVRPLGGSVSFHTSPMSEEEIKIMVDQSEEYGVIEPEEKEMIHNVFEFADRTVHEVMTPRLDITAVEADAGVEELIRIVTESGHSRIPVYDDNLDNIVGIVHVKDVLRGLTGETPAASIRDVMRDPYFIPDAKRVDDLLREFKRGKLQVAIVRDEYGTVTGIVTIEDLLEEIVGEIQDEYDVEEPLVKQVDEHTCIVDGRMSLEDFNDRMGVELPDDETNTVGGFVFRLLGHQPEQGEMVQWDGVEFTIEATDGKRIQKVRVVRGPHEAIPDGDAIAPPPPSAAPDSAPSDRAAINR